MEGFIFLIVSEFKFELEFELEVETGLEILPKNNRIQEMIFFVIIGAVVFIVLLTLLIFLTRTRALSSQTIERFAHKILKTVDLDPAHSVMESHKLFVSAISELSSGRLTAAQKISKIQKRLPHAAKIWTHHRLRNRVAHETDIRVSVLQAENARKDFVRALKALR